MEIKVTHGEHEIVYIERLNSWKVADSLLPNKEGFGSLSLAREWLDRREKKLSKKDFTPFEAACKRYGRMAYGTITSINEETGQAQLTTKEGSRERHELKDVFPKETNEVQYAAIIALEAERERVRLLSHEIDNKITAASELLRRWNA